MGEGRDAELFKQLYDAARARLFAYALRRTRSPEDAADVTAEVFTIAWQKWNHVPDDDAQILWLYAVARRVLANRTRKVLRQNQVFERLRTEARRSLAHSTSGVSDDSIAGAEVFALLNEPDREILMLSGWEGLNASQLAYTLECSPLAARIRLHRARGRLAAALEAAELGHRRTPVAVSATDHEDHTEGTTPS